MQEYKLPPRFVEVEPFHANDKIIRAAILFHLVDASEADILMSTVSNIPYNAITCSSPPYLYTLYKLIRAKRPGFPEMTKQEAEDGLAMFLGKHLYPSSFAKEQSLLNKVPSHFSNDQSLASGSSPPNNSVLETPTRHSNAENVSGNNLSTPRIALGPAEDGSIGFQNRSHPRAPIQPAQTIHHENARPAYRHPNRQGRNDTRNDYERMRDDGRDLARYPHEVIQQPRNSTFHRANIIPLPRHREGGKPKDMNSFYNNRPKFSGRASENQSLARHQEQFYSFANMCGLNAQQGLDHLLIMIQPDSLAHSFYFSDIQGDTRFYYLKSSKKPSKNSPSSIWYSCLRIAFIQETSSITAVRQSESRKLRMREARLYLQLTKAVIIIAVVIIHVKLTWYTMLFTPVLEDAMEQTTGALITTIDTKEAIPVLPDRRT